MDWDHSKFSKLNPGEQSLVKWQYQMHGGFFTALWKAISVADGENLERLANAFPLHVGAYRRYIGEPGYWEGLLIFIGLRKKKED